MLKSISGLMCHLIRVICRFRYVKFSSIYRLVLITNRYENETYLNRRSTMLIKTGRKTLLGSWHVHKLYNLLLFILRRLRRVAVSINLNRLGADYSHTIAHKRPKFVTRPLSDMRSVSSRPYPCDGVGPEEVDRNLMRLHQSVTPRHASFEITTGRLLHHPTT